MPIHKRNRSFQNIVRELDIQSIPAEFIQQLSLVCENGDRMTFEQPAIESIGEEDLVMTLVQLVEDNNDLESNVCDVEIVIDYRKLEKTVSEQTDKLLRKNDKN